MMITFFSEYATYWDQWIPPLWPAARMTLLITATAYLIAVILGIVVALGKTSGNRWISGTFALYVEILRGVPVLAILFLLYFGLPSAGIALDSFTAGVLGLAISNSAYLAEVFRSGLQALPRGQREAALAIGLPPIEVFRYILLPQAIRITLPPLLSTFIVLLKDSSLCALIAGNELMLLGRAMASEYFLPLHSFLLVGAVYFAIAWPLSILAAKVERRLGRGRRPAVA